MAKTTVCDDKRISLYVILILFLASFVTISIVSGVSSPIFGPHYCHDASQFEIIGKGWANGLLPYRDLWDSKGPYVFFINMLAYALGGKTVLWALEIINLFVTFYFFYKIVALRLSNKASLFWTSMSILIFGLGTWYAGNTQSEWCLPYLAAATYCIYAFALSNDQTFKPLYGYVLGLAIGICIMSRPSNAIYLIFCTFAVGCYLLSQKQWKNIGFTLLAGIGGIATPIVPFSIYFWTHGLLSDMWYATLIYNFRYVASSMSDRSDISLDMLLAAITAFSTLSIGSFVLGYQYWKNKAFRMLFFIIVPCFAGFLYVFFGTARYVHYFSIFIPIFFLIWVELCVYCKEHMSSVLVLGLILLLSISDSLAWLSFCMDPSLTENPEVTAICDSYFDEIPKEASVLTINEPRQNKLYLQYDHLPNNKYFLYQLVVADISPEEKQKIYADFCSNLPDYVLYSEWTDYSIGQGIYPVESSLYGEILSSKYDVVESTTLSTGDDIILFRLK